MNCPLMFIITEFGCSRAGGCDLKTKNLLVKKIILKYNFKHLKNLSSHLTKEKKQECLLPGFRTKVVR